MINFLPPTLGLEFDSWYEFDKYWKQYEEDSLASYRCRDSCSREKHNAKHPCNPLPKDFDYSFKKFICNLGLRQPTRGEVTPLPADLPFTPQQIRNLINSRLGTATTEDRLKGLIADFVNADGITVSSFKTTGV
ncbi:unnamed protein product [Phytophthora fragariaefolia]|uniref:Unnamed protein product n=1 Tax=Phytophthora fragariaefolia TaxID=1490495 RepID=A0A9W6Y8Z4_9STRA|nr:unnamed protein product [Phytophthora fragariaefolia]